MNSDPEAGDLVHIFGAQQGGSQYRRLVASFQGIFGTMIFLGADCQREPATAVHRARLNS